MDFRPLFYPARCKYPLLLLSCVVSPGAFAFTEYVSAQSPQHVVALIYGLLGLMTILFITPLLQFYFGAVRATDHKQALKEQTRALDAAQTGVIYLGKAGTINYANETAIDLLGKEHHQLLHQAFLDQIDKRSVDDVKRALSGERLQTPVHAWLGQRRVAFHLSEWLTDEDHPFRIVTLIPADCTSPLASHDSGSDTLRNELSQTKHALKTAEKTLQNLIDFSPVGIGKLNNQHEIINANNSLLKRLNYSENELRKGNIYKLFSDPEDARRSAKKLEQDNKIHGLHVDLTTRDGERYPTEFFVDQFDRDSEEYWFWMINYCDEQFQYDKFNALLENSGLAVAILTDTGFSKLNKKAYKLFQLDADSDIKALSPYARALNHSQEKADELATLVDTLRVKGGTTSLPWTHRVNDESLPCEITMVPVYKDHTLDSVLCIWTDLRELEQAGAALKSTTAKLESVDAAYQQQQRLLMDNEHTQAELTRTQTELKKTQSQLAQIEQAYASHCSNNDAPESDAASVKADLAHGEPQATAHSGKVNDETGQDLNSVLPPNDMALALAEAKSKIKTQHEMLAQCDKKLTVMALNREAEQHEVSALLSQLKSLKQSVYQKEQKIELLDYQLDRLETEQENATDFINRLTEQLATQQKSLTQLKQKTLPEGTQNDAAIICDLQTQLSQITANCTQEKQSLIDAKMKTDAALAKTSAALEKAQQRVQELAHSSQQADLDNKQQTELIDNLMSQVAVLKQEIKQQHAVEQGLAQQKQTAEEWQRELAAQRESLHLAQTQCKEAQQQLTQLKQHMANIEQQKREVESQLSEQQQKAQDYLAVIRTAEAQQALLNEKLQDAEKRTKSKTQRAEKQITLKAPPALSGTTSRADIESIVLPNKPVYWFDLNYFWANQPSDYRLSLSLTTLLDELDHVISQGDIAIQSEKMTRISSLAQPLLKVSKTMNAEQLIDLAQGFTRDCRQGMKDNALVRWQPTKQALQNSQRVVYEQLQHI